MLAKLKNHVTLFYRISLHRELLEQEIRRHASMVKGKVLDAGSKNRRYDTVFSQAAQIVAVDRKPEEGKNVIKADITALPFSDSSFDTLVSFEVLEYVLETARVLKELARVLKPGGRFIFSVPFLNPVHGDVDLVRYTEKGWRQNLEQYFEIEEVNRFGGRFTVMWDFYFEKVRNSSGQLMKCFLYPGLAGLKILAGYLDRREESQRYPMGYFFVCRNTGNGR